MARITKKQLLEASEEIETNYDDMNDELIILLAEYIGKDIDEYTLIKKMGRLGELTEEAVRVIAKRTRKSTKEVRKIYERLSGLALEDIEPLFEEAKAKGFANDIGSLSASILVANVISDYVEQTAERLSGMQPVILNSIISSYQEAVNMVVTEKIEIERKLFTQKVQVSQTVKEYLKEGITSVTEDREITHKAITNAVQKIVNDGITGFIDNGGREWQPDTYSSMVIRTNAHNVAIDSIKARQEEYGSDLFQVSSHSGARPLCYPYQGKLLSWGDTGGRFTDGAGVQYEYDSIKDTSYGEPAGLFGINCGHYPLPVIPSISIVHEQPVQDERENNREYRQSQEQRYLEREIRKAKREYEAQRVSGASSETLKAYKDRISAKQSDMRSFISDTGRTRRYDREKIVTEKR